MKHRRKKSRPDLGSKGRGATRSFSLALSSLLDQAIDSIERALAAGDHARAAAHRRIKATIEELIFKNDT